MYIGISLNSYSAAILHTVRLPLDEIKEKGERKQSQNQGQMIRQKQASNQQGETLLQRALTMTIPMTSWTMHGRTPLVSPNCTARLERYSRLTAMMTSRCRSRRLEF